MLAGVDKPVGMTSHDAVSRLRRALGEGRVGHAGTLDPLASGVLVVGIGPAARLLGLAAAQTKSYVARFAFGCETETDDAEGAVRRAAPAPEGALDLAWARGREQALLRMTSQVPPAYSAVQVGGVRAYAAARAGEGLELGPRPVEVLEARVLAVGAFGPGEAAPGATAWWDVALTVSKGTYVRALARDLGRELGSACHVAALRRTASGPVTLADCAPLDEAERLGAAGLAPLDPARVLGAAALELSEGEAGDVACGRRLSAARACGGAAASAEEGALLALEREGRLMAVARRRGGAVVPEAVFPGGVACGRAAVGADGRGGLFR